MLFKIAALFVIAATTRVQTTGNRVQWVYDSGPDKGYICALMEQDGSNFDVYLPVAAITAHSNPNAAMAPVPWQHFPSKQAAVATVQQACK